MAGIGSLSEDLVMSGKFPVTDAYSSHLLSMERRMNELDPSFFLSPGVLQEDWKSACYIRKGILCVGSPHTGFIIFCAE